MTPARLFDKSANVNSSGRWDVCHVMLTHGIALCDDSDSLVYEIRLTLIRPGFASHLKRDIFASLIFHNKKETASQKTSIFLISCCMSSATIHIGIVVKYRGACLRFPRHA